MIMSSTAETCTGKILVSYCIILKKSQLRQKFTHQKKYKNLKITKKCIVSVPSTVPNNLVMFNPMYKKWSSMGLKNTQKNA